MKQEELKFIFRIKEIDKIMDGQGAIEIHGTCSLTGKYVIRYLNKSNNKVFEFHYKKEQWVPINEGVCSEYSYNNEFCKFILPFYENNVIYLNHEKRKNI